MLSPVIVAISPQQLILDSAHPMLILILALFSSGTGIPGKRYTDLSPPHLSRDLARFTGVAFSHDTTLIGALKRMA